jgi:hypothetical protein
VATRTGRAGERGRAASPNGGEDRDGACRAGEAVQEVTERRSLPVQVRQARTRLGRVVWVLTDV